MSGSEKRIKELKLAFDSPDRYGKGLVWEGYTVHDAANVFRRYLNDLPEPVVPLDLYEEFREPLRGATKQAVGDTEGPQFVDSFDVGAAISKYQQLITELPPLNRQLLLYILDLLAVFAAKADENRMNSQNLAAIFQPGMLSHPNHAMAPEEYRLNQCVIIFLIENQDHFLIGMHGTAADEKTVREVSKGTSPVASRPSPATPRTPGIVRSASNASAGAESVARDGKVRRNRSTSSRHSRQSNGAPSPGSPALSPTPTGGLGRSNTLPSKKSPALGSGRFAKRTDQPSSPVAPLTPLGPPGHAHAPPTSQDVITVPSNTPPLLQSDLAISPAAIIATSVLATEAGLAGRSEERELGPASAPMPVPVPVHTPEVVTPSRERKLQSLFQRSPTSEADPRQPNKLRKKRLPGSTNPSAQSSSSSLHPSTAVSPNSEAANPMDQIQGSEASENPPASPGQRPAVENPSDSTPRASQIPPGRYLPPTGSENMLKPKNSPPTSLHSSFNESDVDQLDDMPASTDRSVEPEREKKKRWRLSRRKDDAAVLGLASPGQPGYPIGSNMNAEMSTSSIGSAGNKARHSFTGESEPTLAGGEGQYWQEASSREAKDGREEPRGLTGWLKTKYREAKEEHRRNKSPPADRGPILPTTQLAPRGKSMEIKRSMEEEKLAPKTAQ